MNKEIIELEREIAELEQKIYNDEIPSASDEELLSELYYTLNQIQERNL